MPITPKNLLRIAEICELLNGMLPAHTIELHSDKIGWVVHITDAHNTGYRVPLSYRLIERKTAVELAELIYDNIALNYTD